MEKSARPREVGGMHAHPLSLYLPSRTKLWCTLQRRGRIHSPYFYSTPICTLCSSVQTPDILHCHAHSQPAGTGFPGSAVQFCTQNAISLCGPVLPPDENVRQRNRVFISSPPPYSLCSRYCRSRFAYTVKKG
jgi:hypothetical protein